MTFFSVRASAVPPAFGTGLKSAVTVHVIHNCCQQVQKSSIIKCVFTVHPMEEMQSFVALVCLHSILSLCCCRRQEKQKDHAPIH